MNTQRTRTATLALGLALAFAAVPTAAHADTYCVHGPCGDMPETYPQLDTALFKAKFHDGVDRILIGPGSLTPTNLTIDEGNPVELIGSGAGVTRLVGGANVKNAVLRVQSSASTVSGLSIQMSVNTSQGLVMERGKASGIEVVDGPAGAPTTTKNAVGAVLSPGTSLRDSRVVMSDPGDAQLQAVAASGSPGLPATIEDSELSGFTGLIEYGNGLVDARRLKILNSGVGVAGRGDDGTLRLTNSLIEATRTSGSVAISGGSTTKDTHTRIEGWGVTAIGKQNDSIGASSVANSQGVVSAVELSNSTLSGFSTSLRRKGGGTAPATLNIVSSNYDDASTQELGQDGGQITGSANVNVDPAFVDASDGDYRLKATSPLVDAGASSPFGQSGSTDLAGAPRLMDGDLDGTTRADIGAFEYQPPVQPQADPQPQVDPQPQADPQPQGNAVPQFNGPVVAQQVARDVVAPAVSGFALSRSTVRGGSKSKVTARFGLSEAATVRLSVERRTGRGRGARTVTVASAARSAVKGSNRVALSGKLAPASLKPGTYRLAITARDAAGNRSAVRRVTFRVTPKR